MAIICVSKIEVFVLCTQVWRCWVALTTLAEDGQVFQENCPEEKYWVAILPYQKEAKQLWRIKEEKFS
nr:hypothetical protein 3 [Deltaproteobacteria bacterium]